MPEGMLKSPMEGGIYLSDQDIYFLKEQHKVFSNEKGIEVIIKILTERS